MKIPRLSKKFWVTFTTMAIVAAAFTVYFLGYVKNREKEFIRSRYRALEVSAINIQNAKAGFQKSIQLKLSGFIGEIDFSLDSIFRANSFPERLVRERLNKLAEADRQSSPRDAWAGEFSKKIKQSYEIFKKKRSFEDGIIFSFIPSEKIHRHKRVSIDSVFFFLDFTDSLSGIVKTKSGFAEDALCGAVVPMATLFKAQQVNIDKKFDDFFIIKTLDHDEQNEDLAKNNNQEKNEGKKEKLHGSIAYQTFNNQIRIETIDSLLENRTGLLSSKVRPISINGIDYKLFMHRLAFSEHEDWILCGLVDEKTFNAETRQVTTFFLVATALIVLFLFLAMPVLKLLVMSEAERLEVTTILYVGFSIVVGTIVVTFIILFSSHNQSGKDELKSRITNIANQVRDTFLTELNEISSLLDYLEKKQNSIFRSSPTNDASAKSGLAGFKRTDFNKSQLNFSLFDSLVGTGVISFNEAIWLDSIGDQALYMATHEIYRHESPLNLRNRKYFSLVLKDSLFELGNGSTKKEIALQSIRSWRSSEPEAGISKAINFAPTAKAEKSWRSRVLAIATRLYSVMDPILPPGFGFCIIDESGSVLFHSDSKMNLQENLFDEASPSSLVRAAVLGDATVDVSFDYSGKSVHAVIEPIQKMPLHLVTFYDMNYYQAPISLTVSYSSMAVTVMLLIIGFHLLIYFIFTFRPTSLKIRHSSLRWLRPHQDLHPDYAGKESYELKYQKSIVFLIIVAFPLLLLALFSSSLWLMVTFLLLPAYLFTFQFILFRREDILKKKLYWLSDYTNPKYGVIANQFVSTSMVFVILLNLFLIRYLIIDDKLTLIIVQLLIILVMYITLHLNENNVKKITAVFGKQVEYPQSYRLMFILWLVLTSVLAPVCIYKYSYYTQNDIWARYLLLEESRQNYARKKLFDESPLFDRPLISNQREKLEKRGCYLETFKKIEFIPPKYSIPPPHNPKLEELIFKSGPLFGGVIEKARQAIFTREGESRWYYSKKGGQHSIAFVGDPETAFEASTVVSSFSFLKGEYALLILCIWVITIFIVSTVVDFVIKNLFGLGVFQSVDQSAKLVQEDRKQLRIFLVGLSGSQKRKRAKQILPHATLVDFRCQPEPKNADEIIIWHFEHGINDHAANQFKLKYLNDLIHSGIKKLVILSAIQPTAVVNYYEKMIQDLNDQKNSKEYYEYKQALRIWKNILGGFSTIYNPLPVVKIHLPAEFSEDEKLLIQSELGFGHYLKKLVPQVPANIDVQNYRKREDLILQIEDAAETYYMGLWNSFSNVEKHVLFDLAKDGFVNLKNFHTIRTLLQKGVLVLSPSPSIMNASFANFILNVVREDEEIRMEQESKRTGTWHTVQLALIITLFALASFIALAREGFLGSLNAWITAVTGLFALITRFGISFGGSKIKEG